MGYAIIQVSRQRPVDDRPRLVEALQGKNIVGEIRVRKIYNPVLGPAIGE